MVIKIKPEQIDQRLDKFLTEKLPITRSQIKKLIITAKILLNGEITSVHHFLKAGDEIKIIAKEIKDITKDKKLEPNKTVKFKVVYEDDNILVIDKPAGLLIHPTEKMEPKTLAAGLLAKYPEIAEVGENELRPGIVHRLDKSVSGLLLVCKTQKAFDFFKKKFQDRKIKKIYTALVHGKMERLEGTIDLPIARSKTKGKMAVKSQEQGGKEAITNYTVTKQYNNLALLEVEILTGRTHQIRAHLNALQHPVVGDKLYTQKWVREKMDIDRPFLHASYLSFKNLDGKKLEFKSKLPSKLQNILKSLT
ncbi:MAG: RluA family pseudouridine synthase [Candidatus Parcubacteria bacterium]|nr:RluA family pseudouridine synthase [Candidatus Parcubacteria bacterium]